MTENVVDNFLGVYGSNIHDIVWRFNGALAPTAAPILTSEPSIEGGDIVQVKEVDLIGQPVGGWHAFVRRRWCGRAHAGAGAALTLYENGHTDVPALLGGMAKWVEAGFPMKKSEEGKFGG